MADSSSVGWIKTSFTVISNPSLTLSSTGPYDVTLNNVLTYSYSATGAPTPLQFSLTTAASFPTMLFSWTKTAVTGNFLTSTLPNSLSPGLYYFYLCDKNNNNCNILNTFTITCLSGTYIGTSSCITCPVGKYSSSSGALSCTNCIGQGKYCPAGSTANDDYENLCPAGFYCATPASKVACPSLTFCPQSVIAPQACPFGFTCPSTSTISTGTTFFGINYIAQLWNIVLGNWEISSSHSGGFYALSTAYAAKWNPQPFGVSSPNGYQLTIVWSVLSEAGSDKFFLSYTAASSSMVFSEDCSTMPGDGVTNFPFSGIAIDSTGTSNRFILPYGNAAFGCFFSDSGIVVNPGGVFVTTKSTACPAGNFCATNSNSATLCTAGTYSGAAAISCTPCPAGSYSTTVGATSFSSCILCAAGTYSATVGATSSATCISCLAGNFCPWTGSTAFGICAAGKYSGALATSCTPCIAGKYSGAQASFCTQCVAGKYSDAAATSCTPCDAGKYSDIGASICTFCAAGKFSDSGDAICTSCSSATSLAIYCPAGSPPNTDFFNMCSAGYYCANSASKVVCASNTFCPQGVAAPLACPFSFSCTSSSVISSTHGSYFGKGSILRKFNLNVGVWYITSTQSGNTYTILSTYAAYWDPQPSGVTSSDGYQLKIVWSVLTELMS